jgi:hypothetical protein
MGTVEINNTTLTIHSHIITYGNAADPAITESIREEIEAMWNEPQGSVLIDEAALQVVFRISSTHMPSLTPLDIYENLDPRNNYFRIEEFVHGNISFVDGIGCNTGYFLLENLYKGSTTAAHEYGHTLGLLHPSHLDLRGKGQPGIMYPRGTLVDPSFQYNPAAHAGDNKNGGTMHPRYRKVLKQDIGQLKLHKLDYENARAIIGEFTSAWHPDHRTILPGELEEPGIMG